MERPSTSPQTDLTVAELTLGLPSIGPVQTALERSLTVPSSASSCPLLDKLPAEIRLQIYKDVLQDHIYRFRRRARLGRPVYRTDDYKSPEMPPILLVCAKITHEVIPVLASMTTLKLYGKTSINRFLRFNSVLVDKTRLEQAVIAATEFKPFLIQRLIRALPKLRSLQIHRGLVEDFYDVAVLNFFEDVDDNHQDLDLKTVDASLFSVLDVCFESWDNIYQLANMVYRIPEKRRPKFEVVCELRPGLDWHPGTIVVRPLERVVLYKHWTGLTLATVAALLVEGPAWELDVDIGLGDSKWI